MYLTIREFYSSPPLTTFCRWVLVLIQIEVYWK